jgi:hypothetical protein
MKLKQIIMGSSRENEILPMQEKPHIVTDHDYDTRTVDEAIRTTQTLAKLLKKRMSRYLPA